MQEILDKLINEIKRDQRYLDYLEAEKKLHTKDIEELLRIIKINLINMKK